MKKPLISTLLAIFIILSATAALALPARATELTVAREGGYKTIHEAVNAANPGDTITVSPGTFAENVLVDKPLTIRSSSGASLTTIEAAVPAKDVFLLTGTDIRIEGFTIVGKMGSSGVKLDHASRCVISNNIIYNNIRAVYLYAATDSDVSDNNVSNNGYGVYLDGSSDNTVLNNVALYERGMPDGSALGDGIFMNRSPHNIIAQNVLSNNRMFGISLWDSAENTIQNNTISANGRFGIRLRSSSNNTLIFNTIRATTQDGIYIGYSWGNKICLNNFMNNPNNINNPQGNIVDSPQQLAYTYNGRDCVGHMGNYYSDYRGTDRNGNGIGDTVYPIGDGHPLVKPVEQYGTIRDESGSTSVAAVSNVSTAHNSSQQSDPQNGTKVTTLGLEAEYAILGVAIAASIAAIAFFVSKRNRLE